MTYEAHQVMNESPMGGRSSEQLTYGGNHQARICVLEEKFRALETAVEDHEVRLRSGERMEYRLLAYALAGSLIGGAISTAIAVLSIT